MIHTQSLEDRVAEHYGTLSSQLRKAADYVVAHPLDVSSRSLRSISDASHVSPATFSRLARALGFASFEDMRDTTRSSVGHHVLTFSEKAEQLRAQSASDKTVMQRQSDACIQNIRALTAKTDDRRITAAAAALGQARRVYLFGALGSTGIVEYMSYLAQYFAPNWVLMGRMGASMGSIMSDITSHDVLLVITKTPYAGRAVTLARLARQSGAEVVLLTDMHHCPALEYANHSFIVPSESPQFFSSYVATLVLLETLIAMIVTSSEDDATASIRKVEAKNRELGEYWTE